jgi:chemotaxis protein CheY-P-specific phosphatase CheC
MIASNLSLTDHQIHSLGRFMVDGTGRTLDALENMFGLEIDQSDSSIEIAPAANSEYLKHLGDGTLYTVSSALDGELQGRILLLMRVSDFESLGQAMKPLLSLMYLSDPNADLATLDSQKDQWMEGLGDGPNADAEFHNHMMDALAELGNVLIGLYSKAIYRICRMNSDHSIPYALKDKKQKVIRQVISSAEDPDQPYLVIENEFVIQGRNVNLWCVISPTQESFAGLMKRIEGPLHKH